MRELMAGASISHRTFPGLTRDLAPLCAAHRGPGSSPGKWWLLVGGGA